MLLNGGRFACRLQLLDIARHMHGPHVLDAHEAPGLAPAQEGGGRLPVGRAGVLVADIDREEFNEAPRGPLPCPLNQRRQLGRCRVKDYLGFRGQRPIAHFDNEQSLPKRKSHVLTIVPMLSPGNF